jgi:acyl carrier protein
MTQPLDRPAAEPVVARVNRLLREDLLVTPPSPDADLLTTGLIDSVALVELCVALERVFQVRVGLEDLDPEHFRSVNRIASFVCNLGAVPGASTDPLA